MDHCRAFTLMPCAELNRTASVSSNKEREVRGKQGDCRQGEVVMMRLTATVDYENNAETWWEAIRVQEPKIAKRFERADRVRLTMNEYRRLEALPGWSDGPHYAKHPLIVKK
jgi:hypothetical protein